MNTSNNNNRFNLPQEEEVKFHMRTLETKGEEYILIYRPEEGVRAITALESWLDNKELSFDVEDFRAIGENILLPPEIGG